MHYLFRNQIIVNSLHQLPHNSFTQVLNPIRCLTHLNSNPWNSKNSLKCNQNNRFGLQNGFHPNVRQSLRTFKTSNFHLKGLENYTSFDFLDGMVYKIRRYFGYSSVPSYMMRSTSVYLYEACSDAIDIQKFITNLNLKDTYLSWFLVTQIHVWMCMTRAMSEGKEGRHMRNQIVGRMWEDCEERIKMLGHMPGKVRKEGLQDLLHQFQAAIFAYDEGFLSDDKTLAAALWRTLFMFEDVDPQSIELMVSYIRAQLEHLQTIGNEKFFFDGKITWKDFPPLYP